MNAEPRYPMPADKLRVAIFEDNVTLLTVLKEMLDEHPSCVCVAAESDALNLKNTLAYAQPQVVIMDIDLPEFNGIEATRFIKEWDSSIHVLILTVFEDDVKIYNAICAGADGYLLKNSTSNKIIDALNEISRGGAPMSPMIARKVLQTFKLTPPAPEKQYNLSQRELEILYLLTEGLSYKMIADKCYITIDTVKYHSKHIYEKLQVHSKSEAVIKAIKHRIVN